MAVEGCPFARGADGVVPQHGCFCVVHRLQENYGDIRRGLKKMGCRAFNHG